MDQNLVINKELNSAQVCEINGIITVYTHVVAGHATAARAYPDIVEWIYLVLS